MSKHLYGAFNGRELLSVSHSVRALGRRHPIASIRRVCETNRIAGARVTRIEYEVIDKS